MPRTSVPDHADSVVAKLDDQQRLSAIERAFAQLNDYKQDVIALCVWQGLEYADAARRTPHAARRDRDRRTHDGQQRPHLQPHSIH